MTYGPNQYYADELNSWKRIIAYHKEELRECICQIGLLSDPKNSASLDGKAIDSFADQLIIQESHFEYIGNLVTGQHLRLGRAASNPESPIEDAITIQQDVLRSKMKSAEQTFLRTKYSCSIFLSTFLNKRSLTMKN